MKVLEGDQLKMRIFFSILPIYKIRFLRNLEYNEYNNL